MHHLRWYTHWYRQKRAKQQAQQNSSRQHSCKPNLPCATCHRLEMLGDHDTSHLRVALHVLADVEWLRWEKGFVCCVTARGWVGVNFSLQISHCTIRTKLFPWHTFGQNQLLLGCLHPLDFCPGRIVGDGLAKVVHVGWHGSAMMAPPKQSCHCKMRHVTHVVRVAVKSLLNLSFVEAGAIARGTRCMLQG